MKKKYFPKSDNSPIILLFFKYFAILYAILDYILIRSNIFLGTIIIFAFVYLGLIKRAKENIIQFHIKELSIIFNYLKHLISELTLKNFFNLAKNYKYEIIIIAGYVLVMLSVIQWGLSNNSNPFPYFMDELHYLQVLGNVVKSGTSNFPTHENGPMLFFVNSVLFLSPLYLLHIINPFAIIHAISSIEMQRTIYISLRLETLIFGVLTALLIIKISKILKINSFLTTAFLIINPVWLSWSNYFKYEIELIFWMVLFIFFMLRYMKRTTKETYLLAGIASALAVSTKITGVTLLLIYIFSFFYLTNNPFKKLKTLGVGLFFYISTFVLFGIPDIIFGHRSMLPYLYANTILAPQQSKNYLIGYSHVLFNLLLLLPAIFGHFLYWLAVISVGYLVIKILFTTFHQKTFSNQKVPIFLLLLLILFAFSLSPLWFISANRALVLLPFMVLIVGLSIQDIFGYVTKSWKLIFTIVIILGLIIQILESYGWIALKYSQHSQQVSSVWIKKNIPKKTTIGIMNVPIYQGLPDVVIKEFYEKLYGINKKYLYNYKIIDVNSSHLPKVIVLSNAKFEYLYIPTSPKKSLLIRMYKEGYHEIAGFSPTDSIYKMFVSNDIVFTQLGLLAYPLRISIFTKNKLL